MMTRKRIEFSDSAILESLSEDWETVGQLCRRLPQRPPAPQVADTLERLAAEGLIERKAEGIGVQRRRGQALKDELTVRRYRRSLS